jgi:flagellar hook-length control protein FliK
MICADVQSLARAAPDPAAVPRVSTGDADNSFDQFLQAVTTSDRSSTSDNTARAKSSEYKAAKEERVSDQNKPVEKDPVDQKPVNEKKVDEKQVEKVKSEDNPEEHDNQKTEVIDEGVQAAIAAAVAAQIASVAAPVQQVETRTGKETVSETAVPVAVVPVMPNQQSTVIQLPDTEPQPLPDELKQAIQQPKVEAKDFQALVEAASQDLESQTVPTEAKVAPTAITSKVVENPEIKALDTQEPAVKVVDLNVQPEDAVELESNRATNTVYGLASVRNDNLVQQKALPLIQKISTEVVELAREQGQSMRIQIHPENLGKIDLRLISNSDGMKVVMTAEVPATAKLLETHLDQLQKQLSNAGLSISGMSVNSQGAQGQFANQSLNQSQTGNQLTGIPVFQKDTEIATPQIAKVSSSSLDYRV